jgi:hypothetical protein
LSTAISLPNGHDQRGTALFHKLLDAKRVLMDAQAAYDAAHAALAAHIVWDDGEAQPTILVPVPPAETVPAPVLAQPEPKPEHHKSFTPQARRSFFARLGKVCAHQGMDKELAYELSERVGAKLRPSAMTTNERRAYLEWLGTLDGFEAYQKFVAELELEKRCAEHRQAVAAAVSSPESAMWRGVERLHCGNCGRNYYGGQSCPGCGWQVAA